MKKKRTRKIRKIVLTGGPGVGKTSIVQDLKLLKYDIREEIFTRIFKKAEEGGYFSPEFLKSPALLEELIQTQKSLEALKVHGDCVFFDRSRVDILGFCKNLEISPSPERLAWLNQNEYDLVFLVEPLPHHLYDQNAVRRQSQEESIEHHRKIIQYYEQFAASNNLTPENFIFRVPYFQMDQMNSIRARTQFILNSIEEAKARD